MRDYDSGAVLQNLSAVDSIDVRSHSKATLELVQQVVQRHTADVVNEHGVHIELGPLTGSEPAEMDQGLLDKFTGAVDKVGVPRFTMPSGAGHDAAIFAGAGIPSAMTFVRNDRGSHNPDESMSIADFRLATHVLAFGLAQIA